MASFLHPTPAVGRTRSGLTRIVVTGPESTGKTTLAQSLAEHYHAPWIPEYARDYAEKSAMPLTSRDVTPIARGQIAREEAVFETASGIVILDTDLVSTVVYAGYYYGTVPSWVEQAASERLADLYLLCDIDVPWVADAVRDAQHQRGQLHEAFVTRLSTLAATVQLIVGPSPAERLKRAVTAIDGWRASSRMS